MPATTKRLYLTRHGQAEHNVHEEYDKYPDAILTAKGRKQCSELNDLTRNSIQQKAELIVSSVMRRPMETMLLSYPDLVKRLESQGKPPIILDILQEVGRVACDVPTYPLEDLKNSQDGIFSKLDFSRITPEYASKKGIFAPENATDRAKKVRKWLREQKEEHIVVVAHGDILRTMVDGASRYLSATPEKADMFRHWDNCEVKVFTFKSEDDDEAALVDVEGEDAFEPEDATTGPTSGEKAE